MQQVNLISLGIIPKAEPLRTKQMVLLLGGFSLVLLAVTGWHGVGLAGLRSELVQSKLEVEALRQTNLLSRNDRPDTQALRSQVEQLSTTHNAQTNLVRMLSLQHAQQGFSAQLKSLAVARAEGMWLEEIHFSQGDREHISLKGKALRAVIVAEFLQNLADQQVFSGQSFEYLSVRSSEGDGSLLGFTIVSEDLAQSG